MSIVITDDGDAKEASQPKQTTHTAAAPEAAQTSPGNRMPQFNEILRMSKSGGTLAGDAAQYIDAIQATFDRNGCGITNRQLALEDKIVIAFYNKDKKQAVSITVADPAMEAQREEPASDLAYQIGRILQSEGVQLKNNVVVLPQDFNHASQMARYIMLSIQNPGTDAFERVNKSCLTGKFKVTMNLGDVNTIMRSWYPLESMPRADIGLILWTKVNKEIPTVGGQDWEWEPVLAVSAYTQFVDRQTAHGYMFNGMTSQPKITPKVTITNIQTSIGSPVMYGLAMLFAAEYFIKRNGWLMPYERFGKDIPNIGALVPNTKGKPHNITSQQELQQFLADPNVLAAPTLAVDVTEGRPGLLPQFDLINDQGKKGPGGEILSSMARFMANDDQDYNEAILNSGPLVGQRDVEYLGYVNGDKDSRIIDYLKLITDGASDLSSIARFLYIPQEPQLRGQWISELTDYVSLFRNNSILINPHVIAQVSTAGLNIEVEDDMQSPHNNIGRYADASYSDFSGMGVIGSHHGQPTYSGPNYTPYV